MRGLAGVESIGAGGDASGEPEANTGPQMGWIEAATGAPIIEAMATLLAKGTP
ncbi:hypothetical protein [Amycolatopsis coloradensis]|uniref:hypothetical protein n=1 Tax=Amycolatopsis coloradensis TaxID=76021 RepID=UPI0013017B86|nr:hypothetical protein [Amycolatopsis coloradensis]